MFLKCSAKHMFNTVIVYSEYINMTEIEMKVSLLRSSRTTYCVFCFTLYTKLHAISISFDRLSGIIGHYYNLQLSQGYLHVRNIIA